MSVVGAKQRFEYGPKAGDAGAFRACVFHASQAPDSPHEHLKIAFFFRVSEQADRLAKRRKLLDARAAAAAEVPKETRRASSRTSGQR